MDKNWMYSAGTTMTTIALRCFGRKVNECEGVVLGPVARERERQTSCSRTAVESYTNTTADAQGLRQTR